MAGVAAFGTTLKMGATPVAIANVTGISGPSYSAETIDVTAHDSASNYREYVPSFLELGEISVDINFDPTETTHKNTTGGLLEAFENRTNETWAIEFPDGSSVGFSGYVTGFELDAPFDDKLSASLTIRTTGAATWTYA